MIVAHTIRHLKLTPASGGSSLRRYYTQFIKQHAYIGGAWVGANDGGTFPVTNPATGAELGRVPDMGAAETEDAVQKAYDAFQTWKHTSAKVGLNVLIGGWP